MSRSDSKAEIQHYTPKALLRHFHADNSRKMRQIFALDKSNDHIFRTNISNIGAERRYNEAELKDGTKIELEGTLCTLETHAGHALNKVRSTRRLVNLTPIEGWWIAQFVAWQFMRTKVQRNLIQYLSDQIEHKVRAIGWDPDNVKGWTPIAGKEELKAAHLGAMGIAHTLANRVLGMVWSLWTTPSSRPFWISDNPVALWNARQFGPYGNIGFNVPGIEIYLPIAPTLAMGFWCPTLEAEFIAAQRRRGISDTSDTHKALVEGTPVMCTEETWQFLNSLQVHWSEKYLFSNRMQFDFALMILKEKPEKRFGPRAQF